MKQYCMFFAILITISIKIDCAESKNENPMKKKILILTSLAGGNKHAAQAMQEYLKNDYEIELCPAFEHILAPIDPFKVITFGLSSGEKFYNTFVPGKHFEFLGWLYGQGRWYYGQFQKEKSHNLLRNYFIESKADLIISVIPVINNIILEVAQELHKPFILAPTDLDIEPYIMNISNPTYKNFYLSLPFNDPDITAPLDKANISYHTVGAPLKPSFFTPKDKIALRKKYTISGEKPTVMILMGSLGSNDIKNYAIQLLSLKKPCNLLILTGSNEESKDDLEKLKLFMPSHITMEIIGNTDFVADYMALSDLFITKSGTMSVCEALYMNLPMFLDATSTLLPWEKFNHHFIKKDIFGLSIRSYDDIAGLVNNILEHPDELELYKNNIKKLEKKNFSIEFPALIRQALGE